MFRAFAKTTESTFDVIVFDFLQGAISGVTPDERLKAIIS
jgi:hypothetical protein